MAYYTTPSFFGKLTNEINRLSETAASNLPRLQFESGDLVIKLGDVPSDWLIIHSEVFAAVSPVYKRSTGPAWAESNKLDLIKHPGTGEEVSVRTLAMKVVDDTYVLEGKDVKHVEEPEVDDGNSWAGAKSAFHTSPLVADGWPALEFSNGWGGPTIPAQCARALRIFFSLVYGAELTAEQIAGKPWVPEYKLDSCPMHLADESTYNLLVYVVHVCAYAEYWDALEHIRPAVSRLLMGIPNLWEHVSEHPAMFTQLAKKLQMVDLYTDALRHLVSRNHQADKKCLIS